MAFVKIIYASIPLHCREVIESLSLQNSIFFMASDADHTRITFSVELSQGQRDALAGSTCFVKFMEHAERDAVVFHRFM